MPQHNQEPVVALNPELRGQQASAVVEGAPNFWRLQAIAVVLATIWLLGGLAASHHLIERSQDRLLNHLQDHGISEASHLAHALEQNFRKAEQLAASLALQDGVIAAVTVLNQSIPARLALPLSERIELLAGHPAAKVPRDYMTRLSDALDIKIMFILDRDGSCAITNRTAIPCLGINYQEREYFQLARSAGQAMQFTVGKEVAQPSFFFSNAITAGGEFIGAVVVRFYAEEIGWLLGPASDGSLLVDGSGLVVAAADSSLVMLQMDPAAAGFTQAAPTPAGVQPLGPLPMWRWDTDDYRAPIWRLNDRPYLLFAAKLSGRELTAVRLLDAERLFEARRDLWLLASLLIAIGLLLIVFIERNFSYSSLRKGHLALLSEANQQLSATAEQLYQLAVSDSLTGLKNHRYFMQCLQQQVDLCRQQCQPLALISLDIDHFKRINDTYGHPVGDEVIVRVAKASLALVRGSDVVGRLGGEEFAILLPNLELDGALTIAERIRAWCESHSVEAGGNSIRFTVSVGVAAMQAEGDIKQLLAELDEALYRAKDGGRNQVEVARPVRALEG